jgi:hypothetical protein
VNSTAKRSRNARRRAGFAALGELGRQMYAPPVAFQLGQRAVSVAVAEVAGQMYRPPKSTRMRSRIMQAISTPTRRPIGTSREGRRTRRASTRRAARAGPKSEPDGDPDSDGLVPVGELVGLVLARAELVG